MVQQLYDTSITRMTFVTTKFTFICLWLSAVLTTLCCAQDISGTIGGFEIPNCGEGQFECQNKECIQSELLCDGRADCFDSSDETEFECAKPELSCPDYTFRCTYGACIDKGLLCDGLVDCSADGSDEDPSGVCHVENVHGDFPVYRPPDTSHNLPGGFTGAYYPGKPINDSCLLPAPPTNGRCKLRQITDDDDFEYVDPSTESLLLKANTDLVYTCDLGYKIRGNPVVHCSPLGKWSRKPVCIAIRCRPLSSVSTIANCTHANGRVKPCTDRDPVRPKTRAHVSCRSGYRTEFSIEEQTVIECNADGKWVPEPIRCIPVCGIANPRKKSEDKSSTFPWHATIYTQRASSRGTEKVFRCDATVIQANLVLTAAHCIFDSVTSLDYISNSDSNILETLKKFFVMTGKIHQDYDSLLYDPQLVKKHRVKNVHTTCSFQGVTSLYTTDIALVELHDPLEFSDKLLPVCLDEFGSIQQLLDARVRRKVTTSMRSRTASAIRALPTITVLDIPNSQCANLYNATLSPIYINDDKFCTSYNNETDLCTGDVANDGGGLVFEIDSLWYLTGIVSHVVPVNTDVDQGTCKDNFGSIYTKASEHIKWIQQVIWNLERFKYPPCSRYLPPFHTKTTTPAVTLTPAITTPMPTTTPKIRSIQVILGIRTPLVTAESCLVPSQPLNGEWKLHGDFCEGGTDCKLPDDTMLALGSQLVYRCGPGYRVEGDANVYCRADGGWSSNPVCNEIKCAPLDNPSMIATCSRFGERVDCDSSMSPNTQANVSCRSGYWAQLTQNEIVECNMNGVWEPELFNCIPDCGATFRGSRQSLKGEITAEADNFPWHATLYVQKNSPTRVWKDVRCGATLIQANLLLTAAHCVYNDTTRTTEDPRNLFILMSNIHRDYDSSLHDFHFVRRGAVKNVFVHCKYHGLETNYVSDIALLELQEPFEFFNIQLHPVCLDFSDFNGEILEPGVSGAVIGFGKTAIGVPSDILQNIMMPYVSQHQCKRSNIAAEKEAFISSDKFCAGHNNGSAVCLGDGGGGLFVQINGLWFIMGIVSIDISIGANNGEHTCDGNGYTLYTKVGDYMAWILDVMFHLERHKLYPSCSPDPISSFLRTIATRL